MEAPDAPVYPVWRSRSVLHQLEPGTTDIWETVCGHCWYRVVVVAYGSAPYRLFLQRMGGGDPLLLSASYGARAQALDRAGELRVRLEEFLMEEAL